MRDSRVGQKICIDVICSEAYRTPVARLKPIVGMLMLALFAFASSHPLLEALELIHHEAAHSHAAAAPDSDSDHETADGICRIESNQDEVQQRPGEAFGIFQSFVFKCALLLHLDLGARPEGFNSSSPPELGTTWQFLSRAALPVRAPSFAS